VYKRASQLPKVLDGLGITILSTNRGVMSDRQARQQKLGGEVLATVW
jgi:small subunit ribosomal protein S8